MTPSSAPPGRSAARQYLRGCHAGWDASREPARCRRASGRRRTAAGRLTRSRRHGSRARAGAADRPRPTPPATALRPRGSVRRCRRPTPTGSTAAHEHAPVCHVPKRQTRARRSSRGPSADTSLPSGHGLGRDDGEPKSARRAAVAPPRGDPTSMAIWAARANPRPPGIRFLPAHSVRTARRAPPAPIVVREGAGGRRGVAPVAAERRFPEPVGSAARAYLAPLERDAPRRSDRARRCATVDASSWLGLAPGLLDLPEPGGRSPSPTCSHRRRSPSTPSTWRAPAGTGSSGMTVTRGGSARSTAEPAARAAAELLRGTRLRPRRAPARDCDRGSGGVSRPPRHGGQLAHDSSHDAVPRG